MSRRRGVTVQGALTKWHRGDRVELHQADRQREPRVGTVVRSLVRQTRTGRYERTEVRWDGQDRTAWLFAGQLGEPGCNTRVNAYFDAQLRGEATP